MGADVDADTDASLGARTVAERMPPTPFERPLRDPGLAETAIDHRGAGVIAGEDRRATASASAEVAEVAGFPVPNWDRYAPLHLLGQGGMGRVWLARDLKLERNVAIKFVRGDDADLARRIVSEARAQARVNDDRVCKVYDVGEVEGRVYIAMQHVDGRPLNQLVKKLSYEQKALVMRGAALGVHEAHRAGLIHRDLKPTNVMVEQGADGELRPFVMDFGIARDWTESTTMTGTVLGTPQFMAPEQARGEVKQLDRRADVYSLGATMYAFLTGKAPIEGDNELVVLHRLSLDDAPPPRTHDPDIPADLEAIVMKCLEKERGNRYDSARALADDLGRFLDGAPVLARATAGLGYRLRKTARRHWRALVVGAVVLAVVAVALGVTLRARHLADDARRTSERRAALARRFTERVERIEALARYSALAPPHDLGADRALLRSHMDEVARATRDGGPLSQGPGHYALGRGYLALGDDDRALVELRRAWDGGYRDPRAAYALALAEGHLYQRRLLELERLPPALREQRRPALERRHRDPARDYLRASAGADVPSQAYVDALLAYYEGRFDDALRALDGIETSATMGWFYEAPLLRGQVLHQRAYASRGLTAEQLAAELAASRRAFDTATAIGRSDPALHVALANFEYTVFGFELYGRGQIDEPYRRGLAAIDQALVLVPDLAEALSLRARFQRGLVEHRLGRGEEVAELLAGALADAQRAVELAPGDLDARLELSRCLRQAGAVEERRGEDPSDAFARAVALIDAIAPAERSDQMLTHLGLTHKLWADYLDRRGQDASGHRQDAITAYTSAIALSDGDFRAWINLASNYFERARHAVPSPTDTAEDDLAHAAAAAERAGALQPQSFVPHQLAGAVHTLRAERRQARGEDPESELLAASAAYRRALAINPREANLHADLGMVENARANAVLGRDGDPTPILDAGEASARNAIALAPESSSGPARLFELAITRVRYLGVNGRDRSAATKTAIDALAQALALAGEDPWLLRNAVGFHLLLAELELAARRDGRAPLARARGYLERARAVDPDSPETEGRARELADLERRARR